MVKVSADEEQPMQDSQELRKKVIFKEVSFKVKNTFIDLDDGNEDLKFFLAGRQSSAPARPIKGMHAEFIKSKLQEAPVDPAGPEPEPEESGDDEALPYMKWDRLGTGERWSNEEEAEDPEFQEAQAHWSPSPCFEARQPLAGAPCGSSGYPYAHGTPYPAERYTMMAMPGPAGMSQVPAATYAAQPDPTKDTQKRRRRRAGSSLIDLAKKRMQERCVEEGGALPFAPAAAAPAAQVFCGPCDRAFDAAFKFCFECGQSLQPRLQ